MKKNPDMSYCHIGEQNQNALVKRQKWELKSQSTLFTKYGSSTQEHLRNLHVIK